MKYTIMLFLTLNLYLFPASNAYAMLFKPKNKEDCIQKYVPKTQTKMAVRGVYQACEELFSDNKSVRKRGKCILNLDGIYSSTTDHAVRAIYSTSKCSKIVIE